MNRAPGRAPAVRLNEVYMLDAAGTTKYTYTLAGQLLTEDGPFDDDTVTNTYLHRLRAWIWVEDVFTATLDHHHLVVELNDGTFSTSESGTGVWGPDLSGAWLTHNCYFADGNGNITSLVSGNESVVASYRYDPFGNTLAKSGGLAGANVYRISSKEVYPPSGLYYYGYRFYDPGVQRWLNQDPMGESGFAELNRDRARFLGDGPNAFLFVHNDPARG